MTQSLLPESTEPLHQRGTLWAVLPCRPTHWQLCQIGDRPKIEQAAEQAAEKYPGAEFLVMPPLERPLMPRKLCHRRRG